MVGSDQVLIDTESYLNLKRVIEELWAMDRTKTVPERVWSLLSNIMILEPVTGFQQSQISDEGVIR